MSAPEWDGVPLNPDRIAYHWISYDGGESLVAARWELTGFDAPEPGWEWRADGYQTPAEVAAECVYCGPCLTPTEVAAAVADERDACAMVVDTAGMYWAGLREGVMHAQLAADIRARGTKP